MPERFVAEGLLAVFPPGPGRVLLPQAEAARPVLADGLRRRRVDGRRRRGLPHRDRRRRPRCLERARGADAITFTSGSTVTGYVAAAGGRRARPSWCASGRSRPPRRWRPGSR